jgi:hypothetical protein
MRWLRLSICSQQVHRLLSGLFDPEQTWRAGDYNGRSGWQRCFVAGHLSPTHFASYAFVEARHADDHAWLDVGADRYDLVERFHTATASC